VRNLSEKEKPLAATEAARFDNAVRKMFSVSKDAFVKEESKSKREPRKRSKKSAN
jgi:hypothetical protein